MKKTIVSAAVTSALTLGLWSASALAGEQAQTKQQTSSQPQAQQSQAKTQQGKVARNAGEARDVLIVGHIIDARDVKLQTTAGDQHRLIKVQPAKGSPVVVDLGVPTGQIQQANLSKGDPIMAVGRPARINDQPVLFASNVAELHTVGHGADLEKAQQKNQQAASKESGNKTAASSTQASRTNQQPSQTSTATDGADAAIVYLFDTDNFGRDDYGYYDEDFVWTTTDPIYDRWNTSDAYVWNDMETAHYDIYGFDDAGEEGLWDW